MVGHGRQVREHMPAEAQSKGDGVFASWLQLCMCVFVCVCGRGGVSIWTTATQAPHFPTRVVVRLKPGRHRAPCLLTSWPPVRAPAPVWTHAPTVHPPSHLYALILLPNLCLKPVVRPMRPAASASGEGGRPLRCVCMFEGGCRQDESQNCCSLCSRLMVC